MPSAIVSVPAEAGLNRPTVSWLRSSDAVLADHFPPGALKGDELPDKLVEL
jgi:uncharacterized membrane protein